MTLCAVCELPISPEESFGQAMEGRHQHLYPDQCIRLLRDDLAEVKAQMSGELWNLSQQNAALREDNARLVEALEKAVDVYGKPGGPWNVPSEPGTWLAQARAAIDAARKAERCES